MLSGFYVTVIRGRRIGYLAGPFSDHQAAIDRVRDVRAAAAAVDPFTDFDAFGTALVTAPRLRSGALNSRLGLEV